MTAEPVQAPEARPGLQRTRQEDCPPLARKGQPVRGPTVWYGADLTPADVEFRRVPRIRGLQLSNLAACRGTVVTC